MCIFTVIAMTWELGEPDAKFNHVVPDKRRGRAT